MSVETMSLQEMRERYLASLSPIERMDYELACAREKRAIAERQQDQRDIALLLERIVVRASDSRRRGLLLTGEELRLLAAELRHLKGGAERDYKITLRCDEPMPLNSPVGSPRRPGRR